MSLPRELRLTRSREIQIAREKGTRANGGPFLAFFWLPTETSKEVDLPPPRLSVVTSRRVGNAVVRNRARRIFREIFRAHLDALPKGTQVVIIVRRSYPKYSFQDLGERYQKVIRWWKKNQEPTK
ncbi:MAG: ribonuclease P protein component [Opitutales bacterium]|nr:ribonuclease P protein component [Opitutales bacterium]MCH8540262.1 ribonuclease P protein component [Opitutales bacterium]